MRHDLSLRLAFMGTPDFAVASLEALIAAGHDIAAVYCQPPRPAGRGHRPQPSPVQQPAEAAGFAGAHAGETRRRGHAPLSPRSTSMPRWSPPMDCILPQPMLEAPRLGCLNVHASLLPRWRGAAPIQRAILAGDRETGVTIMQMEEGLDTGPMLLSEARADRRRCDRGAAAARSARDARRAADRRGARRRWRKAGSRRGRSRPRASPTRRSCGARKARSTGAARRSCWSAQVRAFDPVARRLFRARRASASGCSPAEIAAGAGGRGARHGARRPADGRLRRGRAAAAARCSAPGAAPLEADAFLRGFALPPGTVLPCPATS